MRKKKERTRKRQKGGEVEYKEKGNTEKKRRKRQKGREAEMKKKTKRRVPEEM